MKKDFPYVIGLDLGTTSIGWCVIEIEDNIKEVKHKRLIDTGVRIFESPVEIDGTTKAAIRRSFRSNRRRIRRRSLRLKEIKELLVKHGFVKNFQDFEETINIDPYEIRNRALDKLVSDQELSRALLHLSKRRGFKSNRKDVSKDEGGSGEYAKQIKEFNEILSSSNYRTAGEVLYKDSAYLNDNIGSDEFSAVKASHQKRNKDRGGFIAVFTRKQIEDEIKLILDRQKSLGNKKISDDFIEEFLNIWGRQRPFFDEENIATLIGKCSIYNEKNGLQEETRAPINSYAYHYLRSFQSVINFLTVDKKTNKFFLYAFDHITSKPHRIVIEDVEDLLVQIEKKFISQNKEFKTNHLREILSIDTNLKIKGERTKQKEVSKGVFEIEYDKKGLPKYDYYSIFKSNSFLKGFEKSFEENYSDLFERLGKAEIDEIFIDSLAKNRDEQKLLDSIKSNLDRNGINYDNEKLEEAVANLENTDSFGDLSLKALWEIIPSIRTGMHTSTAIKQLRENLGIKSKSNARRLLPSVNDNTLTNPRVKRTLSQTRKVINAIIKKYGSPAFVNIELARDLKNSEETRNNISRYNKNLEKRRNKVVDDIKSKWPEIAEPSKYDIQKYMLWSDQQNRCMLSLESIPADELFINTEIDHAIPWSRVADDSYINRILVKKKINQDKKNRTPFEYYGADLNSEKWKQFVNFVNALNIPGRKKKQLTSIEVPEGFSSRDLNDSRYASRYVKNFIEQNLEFRKFDRDNRVLTVNGGATAIIREFFYDFSKDRDNDRHHAMDAVMVAITTPSIIKKINDFSKNVEPSAQDLYGKRKRELQETLEKPWERFYADIHNRIFAEGKEFENYKNEVETKKLYGDIMGLVKPLFVSRAPSRRIKGPAHAETVYRREGENDKGLSILSSRKSLEKYSNKFGFYDTDPKYTDIVENLDKKQIEKIDKGELQIYKDESSKARIVSTKEGKVSNSAKQIGRGNHRAWVESGQSMVRVDIFYKDKKYYVVPIYVYDTIFEELPDRVITRGKPKNEWTQIDESYEFKFSLYKNDFIRFKRKEDSEYEEGYYISMHSGVGSANFLLHDSSKYRKSNGKVSENGDVGTKSLFLLEKYTIDIMGNRRKVTNEKRLPFTLKYKKKNGI